MRHDILVIDDLRVVAGSDVTAKSIVDGVSLALMRGEVLGLIGESGAGKTTLGLAALGYTRPGCVITDGRIVFDGQDMRAMAASERRSLRGRRIAYVAQSAAAAFNPVRTLLAQVCEAPLRHGLSDKEQARANAINLFRELELPSPETIGDRYPHQVSGGQLQRVMAAMAMSCRPDILVLDEPTTALDVTTQIDVLSAIRRLIREHRTAGLYISHDLAVVAQIADRIMVLRHGRLMEVGPTRDVIERPREAYTRALLSVHRITHAPAVAPALAPQPLLALEGVSAAYDNHLALDGVGLVIERGETLAVVGESGSGKTTLGRVIAGLKPRKRGTILLDGQNVPSGLRRRSRDLLRRIQIIYQMPDVALNPHQKIGDILARPVRFYFGRSARRARERVDELLQLIDLPADFKDRLPSELSGGQKQRVCIARALAAEPDIVICDEVTSALDPLVAEEILSLLERLQRETGIAYLLITHDLSVVRRVAHHVLVLRHGRMVEAGPLPQTFSPPRDPYTAQLLRSVPEMRTDWLDDALRLRVANELARFTSGFSDHRH